MSHWWLHFLLILHCKYIPISNTNFCILRSILFKIQEFFLKKEQNLYFKELKEHFWRKSVLYQTIKTKERLYHSCKLLLYCQLALEEKARPRSKLQKVKMLHVAGEICGAAGGGARTGEDSARNSDSSGWLSARAAPRLSLLFTYPSIPIPHSSPRSLLAPDWGTISVRARTNSLRPAGVA